MCEKRIVPDLDELLMVQPPTMNFQQFSDLATTKKGLLVGSRAWGGETSDSDYDYIFLSDYEKEIKEVVEANHIQPCDDPYTDSKSMYIEIEGKKVNLIFLSEKYFDCWKYAHAMMLSFPKDGIQNKRLRRFTFTMLVDTFAHFIYD
jgi:hypothetical protein